MVVARMTGGSSFMFWTARAALLRHGLSIARPSATSRPNRNVQRHNTDVFDLARRPDPHCGGIRRWSLRLPDFGLALATESTLRETIGSERQARTVIRESIVYGLGLLPKPSSGTPRVVTVLAEQIPEEWLPQVEGVRFERLPLDQASVRWKAQCLRILWVTAGVREEKLQVSVAEGNRCASSGFHREFDRTSQGWVARSGVGGGSGTGTTECPCGGE